MLLDTLYLSIAKVTRFPQITGAEQRWRQHAALKVHEIAAVGRDKVSSTTKPSFIDVLEHVADGVHVDIIRPNINAPSAEKRPDPVTAHAPARPRAPQERKD
jgi:hypothetical protein